MLKIFRRPRAWVVFSYEYFYGIPESDSRKTFDVMKYKKIRDHLVAGNYLHRKKILIPEMVSYDDMRLFHTNEYLKQIQVPSHVSRFLKLGYMNDWDVYILEYFRIVSGGTLMAAKHALLGNRVVFNLGGGFHHAHPDHAAGFCLINDVAIAIQKYRSLKPGLKTMIIDLDYHQGDGNLVFYKDDPDVFTFSLHAQSWIETQNESNLDINLPPDCSGEQYLSILREELPKVCNDFAPGFIVYIAGSDPYEKDTLGDMNLSREQLFERNRFVLDMVRKKKLPMVVVAGGGYGPDSWEIYYDFLRYALRGKA